VQHFVGLIAGQRTFPPFAARAKIHGLHAKRFLPPPESQTECQRQPFMDTMGIGDTAHRIVEWPISEKNRRS
jgi:hypothetical protein